jgi:hypothetical protein
VKKPEMQMLGTHNKKKIERKGTMQSLAISYYESYIKNIF